MQLSLCKECMKLIIGLSILLVNVIVSFSGFGELSTRHNCSLCDKDIAYSPNEEKWKYPIHEENELEYSIFSPMVEEQRQCAILPEVAILRCSHVFHSTCLSETLMQHSDPPCPICNMS